MTLSKFFDILDLLMKKFFNDALFELIILLLVLIENVVCDDWRKEGSILFEIIYSIKLNLVFIQIFYGDHSLVAIFNFFK